MTSRLYRALCPTPTRMGEYELKLLSAEAAQQIESHLNTCPHCRQELALLRTYMDDLSSDLELSLTERVKVWVARLLPGPGEGGASLNLAYGLRGTSGEMRVYEAGDALLTLEVQPDPAQPERKGLLGLVTGVDPSGMEASLWFDDQLVARQELDELGNFIFEGLERGQYELILSSSTLEIHVRDLEV